jgi:uncharacterized protein with GYD domain
MSTYISLLRYTDQGIQNIKGSPARLDAARQLWTPTGVEIKALYLVMGRYDAVTITEAPDDETMAKFSLSLGSRGAVRTETLRAFPEDEYRRIIAALP